MIVAFCGLAVHAQAQAAIYPADTTRVPGTATTDTVRRDFATPAVRPATVRRADTLRRPMQQSVKPKPVGPRPISGELSAGFRLNSNGWSGYMDYGMIKAPNPRTADMFHNVRILQLELTEKKDPRQEKLKLQDASGAVVGKYVYGKINNFYALKLGYGFRKLLAGKPDVGAVSIHWVNVLGVSLGMLKPYYILVTDDPGAIKYTDATKGDFLTQNNPDRTAHIIGSSGFSKGLGEMKFIPGAHFKSALHFDFSANKKNVMAGEVGFNVEYYSSAVPIMANREAKPYFADLFLAIQFGKRW